MKTIIFFVLSLTSILGIAQTKEDSLTDTWKVTAVMDSTPTTSFSDAQAKRLLGKQLIITPAAVRFNKETCLKPKLTTSTEKTFEYFYDGYRMDPKNLHLPPTVITIHLECENIVQIEEFYIQDKNSLIFYHDGGFFYKAVKQK
jgi:hypothetical protein